MIILTNPKNNTKTNKQDFAKQSLEDKIECIRKFCPLDDFFARFLFKAKELVQRLLDTILPNVNFVIGQFDTQVDVRNPGSESIIPDLLVVDKEKKKLVCFEFQNDPDGATIKRANKILATLLTAGDGLSEQFRGCEEFFVVFITDTDTRKEGLPINHIESFDTDAGKYIDDKCHRIYVNCQYKGDDDIGRLVHDLKCSDPDEMILPEFRKFAKKLKITKTEDGRVVCNAIQEYTQKVEMRVTERVTERNTLESIRNIMMNLKMSSEEAMDALNVPVSERQRYRELL